MRCPQHFRTVPNASCPRWNLCCPRCGFLGRLVPCCTMTCSIEYFWAWEIIRSSHQFPFFWLSSTGGASWQSSAARRLNQGRDSCHQLRRARHGSGGRSSNRMGASHGTFCALINLGFQSFFDMEKFTWNLGYGLIWIDMDYIWLIYG
jgi:hypothetical protein